MPTYVLLMKLTEQGARDIKNAPQRIDEGIKAMEALGGKTLSFFVTMGKYDYVGIGEMPGDEAAAAFLLGLAAKGYVKTETLKAFPVGEIAEMVKKLP